MSEVIGIDHVQLAVPVDGEARAREFYVKLLGLPEIARPAKGKGRAFLWVKAGAHEIHFREDAEFRPARLAHPGLLVTDAEAFAAKLVAAGVQITRTDAIAENRFHIRDPFGNRLEFIDVNVGR